MATNFNEPTQVDVNSDVRIPTASGKNVIIDTAGNVGIGTTGPASKLEIKQSGDAAAGGLRITRTASTPYFDLSMRSGLGSLPDAIVFNNGWAGDVAAIGRNGEGYFAGNVGIGTTSPAARLDVQGSAVFKGPEPWIDVTAYGAGHQGSVDDAPFIQNALNAVPATGATVYFPPGVYPLSTSLNLAAAAGPLNLRGAGVNVSVLKWIQPVDGLVGTYGPTATYSATPVEISDLTLVRGAAVANGGKAISLDFQQPNAVEASTVHIHGVQIRSEQPASSPIWSEGIYLKDAWNGHINDVTIMGAIGSPSVLTRGIHLTGKSIDTVISRVKIFSANVGILLDGDVEGALIDHATILYTGTGVQFSTNEKPWGTVSDSHISAVTEGIRIDNHRQVALTGNMIYDLSTQADTFIGIVLTGANSNYGRVTGNYILTSYVGIKVAAVGVTVTGNSVEGPGVLLYGIWLVAPATNCAVVGNAIPGHRTGGAGVKDDNPPSNVVTGNAAP